MVFILKKHIFRTLSSTFQKSFFVPILYWSLSSIGLFLSVWRAGDIHLNAKLDIKGRNEVFDFIVVGAGSAGSVLANRLSRYYSVLLLEAGGEPNILQSIPGMSLFMPNYEETDWGFRTVPQKFGSLNSVNQRSSWSAGRGLGGTGNLNFMLYLKGHPLDYKRWAELTGDPSWDYEPVQDFFKDLESYGNPKGHPAYHGFNGDMGVELPEYQGLAEEFIRAGQEFGYPEVDDNAPYKEGFFRLYHSIKNGIRHSSYRAFLQPIRLRSSLTIRKFSHVNKLLFRDNTNEVYGVEYDRNGIKRRAVAKKEVILSAGTVMSTKILLLSGIGPKEHLTKLGIPVKKDLPVGKHLQDHIAVYLGPIFINKPRTIYLDRDLTPASMVHWFTEGSGVLGTSGAHASATFASSFAKARNEHGWPDIHLFMYGYSVYRTFGQQLAHTFGLKVDEMQRYYAHAVGKESIHILVSGARPYARGKIELSSTSPYDEPVIDPNYLSDKRDIDLQVLVEGIKAALQITENTTTFQHLGGRFTNVPLPGCELFPFRSDEYWKCYAKRYTVTLHHPCGTAAMGADGAKYAVVDSQLRVQGIKNLRVIDASVIPTITTTNTQAPVMMIANKGANMIIKYWKEVEAGLAAEARAARAQAAAEKARIAEQKHNELMEYIFEPMDNMHKVASNEAGHTVKLELLYNPKPAIPKLILRTNTNKIKSLIPKINIPKINIRKKTPLKKPGPVRCKEDDFECWSSKFPPSFPLVDL